MVNVLWIDDEHESLGGIAIDAEIRGFVLHGFKSFEHGFRELEAKMDYYDMVLLDGLFLEEEDQEIGTESSKGLGKAIARLNQLWPKKPFPFFVLSGKDQFTSGRNEFLFANNIRSFNKKNPDDVEDLFYEMKKAAENRPDYKLKHKYRDVLSTCSEEYFGMENYDRILSMARYIESASKIDGVEDKMNSIRKIFEGIFYKLGQMDIVPQNISLNNTSNFLRKENAAYEYEHETYIVPAIIGDNIRWILNIAQDGSHLKGGLKYNVDKYLQDNSADYLYRSFVFLTFDLLIWFKEFIRRNQDVEVNKKRWNSRIINGEWIKGKIKDINIVNGYGSFKPDDANGTFGIHPNLIAANKLKIGDEVYAIVGTNAEGTKQFVKEIKVI